MRLLASQRAARRGWPEPQRMCVESSGSSGWPLRFFPDTFHGSMVAAYALTDLVAPTSPCRWRRSWSS